MFMSLADLLVTQFILKNYNGVAGIQSSMAKDNLVRDLYRSRSFLKGAPDFTLLKLISEHILILTSICE